MHELLPNITANGTGILAQATSPPTLPLYLVGAIAIMMLLALMLPAMLLAWKDPATLAKLAQETESGTVLRVATVLAIVLSVTFIALSGLADENSAAIALLSGISGYVLGSMKSPSPPEDSKPCEGS